MYKVHYFYEISEKWFPLKLLFADFLYPLFDYAQSLI